MEKFIDPNGKYLSIKEVSKLLKISSPSLLVAIKKGVLVGLQIGNSFRVNITKPISNVEIAETSEEKREERIQS